MSFMFSLGCNSDTIIIMEVTFHYECIKNKLQFLCVFFVVVVFNLVLPGKRGNLRRTVNVGCVVSDEICTPHLLPKDLKSCSLAQAARLSFGIHLTEL